MPFTRLCGRMVREERRTRGEITTDEQRSRMSLYIQARSIVHALTSDKPIPLTQAEQEKESNEGEIKEAQRWRKQHDEEFGKALAHPYHFEALMGFAEHVFDEPPEPDEQEKQHKLSAREKGKRAMEKAKKFPGRAGRAHRRD